MTEFEDLNPIQRINRVLSKWEPSDALNYVKDNFDDVNFAFSTSQNLISIAIYNKHKAVIQYLLDNKVDCSTTPKLLLNYIQAMGNNDELPVEFVPIFKELGASFPSTPQEGKRHRVRTGSRPKSD